MAANADASQKIMSLQRANADDGEPIATHETDLQKNVNSPLVYISEKGAEIPGWEKGDPLVIEIYGDGIRIRGKEVDEEL